MKEKFIDRLGVLGGMFYFVFSLFVSIMPFVMIDTTFWITFLLICIEQIFPLSTFVFWIWGLICAIKGVQDIWAIAYYILFAVMFLPFILGCVLDLLRKEKRPKQQYCKFCGSPIDLSNKKCTGCGKQYFRLPAVKKSGLFPKVIVVLSILILGLCVYRNVQYQKQITQMTAQIAEQNEALKSLQSELESAKSDVSEIQDKYRAKFSEAYNLSQENKEMKRIYDYCEKNMVFAISKTYLYHKPHCFMIQSSEASFEGFTVSTAKQKGYTPCWLCCN